MNRIEPLVLAGVLLLVAAGCGGQEPVSVRATPAATRPGEPTSAPTTSAPPADVGLRKSDIRWNGEGDPYNAMAELDDGRRVAMHYRRGKGLYEQHSSGPTGTWTRPRLIYGTKTEACQGIELRAFGKTVAAIADFGDYCSDGEPPMESIAAVGVRDLRTWAHHLTRSFDGWERISAGDGGNQITFKRGSSVLRWSRTGGFTK
jgi:hypothetical protein